MTTGGSGGKDKIEIEILGNMTPIDAALNSLPEKAQANARAAMDKIKREIQTNSATIAKATISQSTAQSGPISAQNAAQYNRATEVIDKMRAANTNLQASMDQLVATIQKKATVVATLSEREAAAVAAAAAKEAEAMKMASQQAQILAGHGAMVGNQFVSFASKSQVAQAGLAGIGSGANAAGYKLQVLGQGLDDLQYVGEMGLRPIINNLMQISPLVGIVAIGVNLLWTNWDKIAQLWQDEDTLKEAKRQKELAESIEETSKAYEEQYKSIMKSKGAVGESLIGSANAAASKLTGQMAIDDIGDLMRKNKLYTPGVPIDEQAKQLLANAKNGDVAANSRLKALVDSADAGKNRFADAYRLHELQNRTGDDKLDQDANKRAAKHAEFMANEAREKDRKEKEEKDKRSSEAAENASAAARRQVLEAAEGGGKVDRKKLAETMAEDMKRAGVKPEEIEKTKDDAAKKLAESIDKRLTEEATKGGTTKDKTAHAALLDMQIQQARSNAESMQRALSMAKKDVQEARVMSSADLAQSMLTARAKSKDEVAEKQLKAAQDAVSTLEEIRKGVLNGVPARIGGRP